MNVQLTERQQRRKRNERANKLLRRKNARIAGRQPERNPEYLDFIRGFHCVVCTHGQISVMPILHSEAAHVGARGLRQKCSDRETLPLCPGHHRTGENAHHVLGKLFWAEHGLDRDQLVRDFNDLYDAARAAQGKA